MNVLMHPYRWLGILFLLVVVSLMTPTRAQTYAHVIDLPAIGVPPMYEIKVDAQACAEGRIFVVVKPASI